LANLSDIDQLVNLRVLMQIEVNEADPQIATDDYRYRIKEYLNKALLNQTYFSVVAVDGSQIIGTAGICFYQKPPSISGGSGIVGYVTNVYTNKNYRGMGVGTKMMVEANKLAMAQKADKLHLGATADGLGIYKAVGFKEPKFVSLELKFESQQENK
jgi:ribosomal protein S18 acetylase RimI-like enzyme